jgi:hypothetical protein
MQYYFEDDTVNATSSKQYFQNSGSGEIVQILVLFDGQNSTVRDSHFSMEYDGGSQINYPTFAEVEKVFEGKVNQGGGTTTSISVYDPGSHIYGYYLMKRSSFSSEYRMIVHNGHQHPARIMAMVIAKED